MIDIFTFINLNDLLSHLSQAANADIPRSYTAIAEWLACMLCVWEISPTKRRVLLPVVFLIWQTFFMVMTGSIHGPGWVLFMMVAVFDMWLFIYRSTDIKKLDAMYYCIRSFVVAEFAASFEWQLDSYFCIMGMPDRVTCHLVLMTLMYTILFIIIWRIYKPYHMKGGAVNAGWKDVLSCFVIALAIFIVSNLSFVSPRTPFSGQYRDQIFIIRTLVDVGGVAILFAYHVQRAEYKIRQELASMESIYHNQYVQYQQSREAMEVINYKYHDLKHHIIALRAAQTREERDAYLDHMEEELKNYEAQNKTGNAILDTLLTTKALYCQKHKILLTVVADGTLLDFMDPMDICSIFGNALDNAIECEKKISDKEKRMIHVSVHRQKDFLIMRFENYYEGDIVFDEALPVTTKKDIQFHGYGLKSLSYTVKKYGGAVDIAAEDGWFDLKILIPLQDKTKYVMSNV